MSIELRKKRRIAGTVIIGVAFIFLSHKRQHYTPATSATEDYRGCAVPPNV